VMPVNVLVAAPVSDATRPNKKGLLLPNIDYPKSLSLPFLQL
jgi:hypothetical protein